jgi:hypothetical protein
MATALDHKQPVSSEELLMSQVVQQEAFTRLLIEKGLFTRDDVLEMVKVVDGEMKRKPSEIKSGGGRKWVRKKRRK